MKISSRKYNKNDLELIKTFLFETYKETKTLQNWFPDRFEGCYDDYEEDIFIWEEYMGNGEFPEKKIVAVANPETHYRFFIQIHPNYSFLENEIIECIENHCIKKTEKESKKVEKIFIVTVEGNSDREKALIKSGFKFGSVYGNLLFRNLKTPAQIVKLPEGFTIRSTVNTDFDKIAKGVRTVFGHGEWFTAEILELITSYTFYNQDLDLVVIAPDNKTIAGFCTFRIDPKSKITQLEPMGILPDYRKIGLAKALLNEGFRRLKKYNPIMLYIGGAADTPAANRLYESVGFTEKKVMYYWYKEI